MDTLTRFELRKIMRRKSFYSGISIILFVLLLLTTVTVTSERTTDENGKDLSGMAAIQLQREYDRQLAGPLTVEKVADAIERHQKVRGDSKNLTKTGGITNEAYARYEVKDQQIDRFIRLVYSPEEYDYYIIDKLKPSDAAAFYQKRMEKVNGYLNRDYSYGNYSTEEKTFFIKMNESIPVPFQMEHVAGWERGAENLQPFFLIIAFVIAVCLAPVFAGEYQSGADSIILSSRYGRNKVIAAKLKASFMVSLGMVVFGLSAYTLLLLGIYGFDGGNASVQMIYISSPVPFTVIGTYLRAVLIGGLACLLVGAVTLWLSSRMSSPFPVIIASGAFLIGPLFIPHSKSSRFFNYMVHLMPGHMMDSYKRITAYEVFHLFGQLIPQYKVMAGFAIMVMALLLPLAYRAFRRHQVV